MSSRSRIAIIGVGNMGEAVLSGIVNAGRAPSDIVAGVRRAERGEELAARYGVGTGSAPEAAASADIVVLGVKPYDVVAMLSSLDLRPGQLVVSLAAGITTQAMEAAVPEGVAVVRTMPNTPSLIGEGMTVVAGGASASDEDIEDAVALMRATGEVAVVDEKHVDAAAAISGSGPAYVFYVAEALVEAGVHLGLPRATASQLVTQTLAGSSLLLRQSGEHPAVLRENVTSPGGTTAAALRVLESAAVRAAFLDATRANRDRSREIATEG
jgi:pyrroline-5-carboxylate reductase